MILEKISPAKFELKNLPLVFNVTIGHNGTNWFHSLFDSHTQIGILPPFSFYRCWKIIGANQAKSPDEMLNLWRDYIEGGVNAWDLQGELKFFAKSQDAEKFYSRLESLLKDRGILRKEVFLSIHEAYIETLETDASQLRIVAAHEHIPFYINMMMQDFPDARFLFLVRDMRAALAGGFRGIGGMSDYLFNYAFECWWEGEQLWRDNYKNGDAKFKFIRNEDLNQNLESSMQNLSNWLGIEYSSSLTESTFSGKPWAGRSHFAPREISESSSHHGAVAGQGNSNSSDSISLYPSCATVDDKFYSLDRVAERWRRELSFSQVVMIESFFRDMMNYFDYPCETSDNPFWRLYGLIVFILPGKKQLLRWAKTYPRIHEFDRISYKIKNPYIKGIWKIAPSFIRMSGLVFYSIGLRFRIYFFPGNRGKRYS